MASGALRRLALPFTHKSPFSEPLTGQMQGAFSQEGPPPFKIAANPG